MERRNGKVLSKRQTCAGKDTETADSNVAEEKKPLLYRHG
jgi:hypothetical protein